MTDVKTSPKFVEITAIVRDKDGNIKDEEVIKISLEDLLKQILQNIQEKKKEVE